MSNRVYWNFRTQSGLPTRITEAELNELTWRTLAVLLVRFEDHIDEAVEEEYLSS